MHTELTTGSVWYPKSPSPPRGGVARKLATFLHHHCCVLKEGEHSSGPARVLEQGCKVVWEEGEGAKQLASINHHLSWRLGG